MNDKQIHISEISKLLNAYQLLSDVDKRAQVRIVTWLISYFQLEEEIGLNTTIYKQSQPGQTTEFTTEIPARIKRQSPVFPRTLGELVEQITPQTKYELVWLTCCHIHFNKNVENFAATQVNDELLAAGFEVKNLTRALSLLTDSAPPLLIQTEKRGTHKQARRVFKLSKAGLDKFRKAFVAVQ